MSEALPQPTAQAELDDLVQGRTRLFALGLGGLNALVGLLNLLFLPPAHWQLEAPLAVLTLIAMLGLSLWLKQPRPAFLVDFAGGTAALLSVSAALVHLGVSQDLQNTSHLMIIATGAGFFLFSFPWFLVTSGLIAGGWVVILLAGEFQGRPVHCGIELGIAILLGLLIQLVRKDLLRRFLEVLVQNRHHNEHQALLMRDLQAALDKVKTLSGLVPICAECKRIRDDQGQWRRVEDYVEDHSNATFSHGLCPPCLAAAKAEFEAYQKD